MADLGTRFDASTVEPNKGFDPLPPDRYVVQIVRSEMRVTKDGMGQYLWLEMDVLEGEYAGRKLFDQLNLVNNNLQTVVIAQRTLSAICHATGRMQVQDSEDLHLIPILADVRVKPAEKGFSAKNSARYLPLDQRTASTSPPTKATTPATKAAPQPAAAPTGAAPWRRKG